MTRVKSVKPLVFWMMPVTRSKPMPVSTWRAGSGENVPLLEAGKLDLALVAVEVASPQLAKSDKPLRIITAMYANAGMLIVRGDSHLETPRSALKRHVKEIVNPAFLRLFDRALYVGAKSRAFYEHYWNPQ